MTSSHPQFATSDVVPFRLTPNMQHFMSPIFMEGILATSLMAMGRCLTEPEVCRSNESLSNSFMFMNLVV